MTRKARLHVNGATMTATRRVLHHPNHPTHRLPVGTLTNKPHRRKHVEARIAPPISNFFHAKIHIPPFQTSIPPGKDFYQFVNGNWARSTPMPAYSSTFGVSEEVESHLDGFLLREITASQALAATGREQVTEEGKIRDAIGRLALSALRPEKQKHSVEHLKKSVRGFACMRDSADIASTIGYMCRFQVPTILSITINPSEKGVYQLNLSPGSLGLSDSSYYAALAPGKTNILYAYTELLSNTTKKLDVDPVIDSIPMEAKFSAELVAGKDTIDSVDTDFQTLEHRYKAIRWGGLLESFGVAKEHHKSLRIHIDSENWLKFLNHSVETIPLESWQGLFALHTILHALPYLPPPFDDWHFSFYGRLLRGQRKKTPQDILTLGIVKQQMAAALGYIFVKKYLRPEFKAQATQFVRKIIHSAEERMTHVDWFTPATRKAAAEKLRHADISAAWSEPLIRSPPAPPSLKTDTLLANIYLLEATNTDRQISYLLEGGPKGLWEESPYAVNAYYYHDTNEIVIPAGSFFWPFFRHEKDKGGVGWNFGGLGAVIGHELTHAFDQEGKEYGPKGGIEAWWTTEDGKAYAEKTKALVRLFGEAKVMGRSVDGVLTLDENLADLGGLAIALDAMKKEIRGLSEVERQRHMREFFLSYAVSWRTKEHVERRLQRLVTDKHAPIELRVNLIVAHFEEWYEAFGVRTDDALYIPPEERIRVF